MTYTIETEALAKHYGENKALDGIDLSAKEGAWAAGSSTALVPRSGQLRLSHG